MLTNRVVWEGRIERVDRDGIGINGHELPFGDSSDGGLRSAQTVSPSDSPWKFLDGDGGFFLLPFLCLDDLFPAFLGKQRRYTGLYPGVRVSFHGFI